jgi:PAS domain S-box-containing protein
MLKQFLDLKLKTKLLIGFSIITLVSVISGIGMYRTLQNLEEVEGDVANCSQLKSGVTDVKFIVAHDLKLLMELITTDNKKELEEFWKQHEVLVNDYDVAYKPLHNLLTASTTWDDNYKPNLKGIQILLKDVHTYRTDVLIPVLKDVYFYRNKQMNTADLKVQKGYQLTIDKLDNSADSKAEHIFVKIDKIEDLIAGLDKISSDEQKSVSNKATVQNFITLFLSLFLAILIALILSNYLVKSVGQLNKMIEKLRAGELPENITIDSKDEIGIIASSVNQLTEGLKITSEFAGEIGKGNFEMDFNPLSEKDVLGNSLLEMRTSLIKVAEDEKKRNWATEGLAKFGDVLRGNNEGLEVLADNIISGLVKYMNANQGGLFIVNDNNRSDVHLELIACYAWNKKKYLHMRIEEGDGLVGQAWQENDTLYITDVPDNFAKITSGLGDANPKSFLIIPLTVNDETFGVIEMASFNLFEQYEIDFANKLAESIASTLSTAKTNERTKVLLEQSQQQTEEMRAQEEEMRQNMEEMQATQEEMERKEAEMSRMMEQMQQQEEEMRQNMEEMEATQEEMEKQNSVIAEKAAESQGILDGINATMATIEFTPQGNVINANANFLTTMKTSLSEIHGKHHSGFVPTEIKNLPEYKTFWTDLAQGIEKKGVFKRINALGETVWLNAIYNPIKNAAGEVVKVIKFATDITEQKAQEAQSKAQTDIINDIAIVSKTDLQGNITYVNDEFLKWAKYSEEEVMGKNHRMLKSGDQDDQIFVDMWKTISSGKIFRGEIKNKAKDGSFYWVDAIVAPVLGEDGKPIEYIAQRFVINDQKEKEIIIQQTLEEARAQEEEIRQNMEEMQAIQEEMELVQREMSAQNDIINSIAIVSKTDLQGNITYVNEEFLKWSKYSLEEVMGQNHRMLKSGDQDDQIFVDMWKTISGGKIFRGEIKNKAKDGSFYWVDAIVAPVLGEDGKPKEYLAQRFVINDAIEQKERDLATKKLYEGEINTMYEKWYAQLKRMEQITNKK